MVGDGVRFIVSLTIGCCLISCSDDLEDASSDSLLEAADADVAAIAGELAEVDVAAAPDTALNKRLSQALKRLGFTGKIESTLEARLNRPLDRKLAELGRALWFDRLTGGHDDNACAGCHSPSHGFGDTQSIAIGIQNNNVVGVSRTGPRNQRRTPMVINNAFYPRLMWNGRFEALSGDPFDSSAGFKFPDPEGTGRFPANDPIVTHLLIAQAHIPPTELVEMAGFTGTAGTIGPEFDPFDDGLGAPVPPPDASGFRNEPLRQALAARLNSSPAYRAKFGELFPSVAAGGPIEVVMFAQAVSEFEFTLTFAKAPIDRFAAGDWSAMTREQKQGALVFFGKGKCVRCHAVSGRSNEMFSDFENHVIAVPQIAPGFGVGIGNVLFDGPGQDEDFGAEQVTGDPYDRYKFRTSPLRNVALQPAFFHNGAFTRLEDAIVHHLDVAASARGYDPVAAGVDPDLAYRLGPIEPVLARVDPLLARPIALTPAELRSLVAFVRDGLLDRRAARRRLCQLVPASVPSGATVFDFEGCP
ncbi:MAG TPA: cytochrome c peroxidase [Kofleriaceae bacterium]|nr:cytochrome c peroxidase [Kofleriaceae bacterium]